MDTGQTMNPGMSRSKNQKAKPYRAFPPARMTDHYILCFAMRFVLAPKTSLVQNKIVNNDCHIISGTRTANYNRAVMDWKIPLHSFYLFW